MEPTFIRPAMTSYLANRTQRPTRDTDTILETSGRTSALTRARHAAGTLLIALGERLTATPRLAYPDPEDDTATVAP